MTLAIELLLAADIRIAASNARFQQLEIRRGIYAFGGATIRLPRDAGWGNAMRWLLTGEEYDAAEAYHAEERLPTVCDIAGPSLQSARLDTEPPTLVRVAQDAISWLARAIAALDESSAEAPTSLAETLARLLAVWTFADVTLRR
jgi:enoyl-CoA hydratase